ncbi:MAG: glycoside hydrolase family 57 protein [Candidatus Bipolaricaulaceae bacterium]
MTEIHVAFLWHMHQPWYLLPDSAEAALPWVRLRAAKDYHDMARHLQSTGFPCTVNFVPSLTEQLRRLSLGEVWDPFLPGGAKEAEEAVRSGLIPMPLAGRGLVPPATFGRAEDLWTWFFLSWTAQTALEEDPRAERFRQPFSPTERDVEELERWQKELVSAVLPLYRALASSGQIELTTTPFYHPILPLLWDTQVAKRARPADEVPLFQAPTDAEEQARRALSHHREVFGRKPWGMWPAEGAVSPEALALLADLGVGWVATDGAILAHTLGRPPSPSELYQPWRLRFGAKEIAVVFRDTILSNLLSFTYGSWSTEQAVEDLKDQCNRNQEKCMAQLLGLGCKTIGYLASRSVHFGIC